MRTIDDLKQKQALPLDLKVRLTKQRIREWINEYGENGVYVSFSGGKDSTVLLHLVREEYPNIPAVFVDTGLEYPEIRRFVKSFDNVDWIKPKMNFKKVVENYGYPFISKEVSEKVYFAQRYLRAYFDKQKLPTAYGISELAGIDRGSELRRNILETREVPEEILKEFIKSNDRGTYNIRQLLGESKRPDGKPAMYNSSKYKWLASSPYMISHMCCRIMKKSPVHIYEKNTGRKGITGQMACESMLRTQQWMKNGCNAFAAKRQVSNPMAFWTEQDVLHYILENNISICSVYGEIIKTNDGKLETSKCKRTGCMFCGYGCHLEKPGEGRFEIMKETHPVQYDYIMKPWEEGGLNYKEVIDWLNEHGNLNIRY